MTHDTSHFTRHTSHSTHLTSHFTRHTSHVTRHTSHVTWRTLSLAVARTHTQPGQGTINAISKYTNIQPKFGSRFPSNPPAAAPANSIEFVELK